MDPAAPKMTFQIQSSASAIASKATVGFLSFPLNCPAHASEQFFHSQCIQSIESTITGNPRPAFIARMRHKSSSSGSLKYSAPSISINVFENSFKEVNACLTEATILINCVSSKPIRKHSQSSRNPLYRINTLLAESVFLSNKY
jgi:hypothetical protein